MPTIANAGANAMMISGQVELKIAKGTWSPETIYEVAEKLVAHLATLHPGLKEWADLPRSAKDRFPLFSDKEEFLNRIRKDIEKRKREFAGLSNVGSAEINLTTSLSSKTWRKPGRAGLGIDPILGRAVFRLTDPEPIYGSETRSIFLQALLAMTNLLNPTFSNTDVKSKKQEGGYLDYRFDRALHPHRTFFGWMGFVPAELQHAQIRDAYEVIPVPGKGTVIVSVPGLFDVTDPAQVEQVHRVEMQLASYDLLPVTSHGLK